MNVFSFQPQPNPRRTNHKHLIGGVLLIFLVLLGAVFVRMRVIQRFSTEIHPLMSQHQEFYAYFDKNSLTSEDFLILEDLLMSFSLPIQEGDLSPLADIMEELPVNTGFFVDESSLSLFVEDRYCQYQEAFAAFEFTDLISTDYFSENGACFTILSQEKGEIVFGESSRDLLLMKQAMNKNDGDNQNMGVFVQLSAQFIGFIEPTVDLLVLQLGKADSDFSESLTTKEQDQSVFYFHQASTTSPELVLLPQDLRYLAKFIKNPGTFRIFDGTLATFAQNPYGSGQSWAWVGITDALETMQNTILQDLADRYPIAVEQVLPDESISLELVESKEAFVSSTRDDQGNDVTLYTYPDGQISSMSDSVTASIEKNPPQSNEEMTNSCIYPNAVGYGYASGDFMGVKLWTSVEFSYDQQKMILCFSKNT